MQVLNVWSHVTRGFMWLRHALMARHFRPEEFKVIFEVPNRDALHEIESQLRADKAFEHLVRDQPKQVLSGVWVGIPYEIRLCDKKNQG